MNSKTVRFIGSLTQTATALAWPTTIGGEAYNNFTHMDIIGVVNTLSGGGTLSIFVQEAFPTTLGPGSGNPTVGNPTTSSYLTTGRVAGLTATGAFYITYDVNNQLGPYLGSIQQNALLGKGNIKQITTTMSGTINALNVDIIAVFWNA